MALRRNLIPVEFDENLVQLAQTIQCEPSDVDLDASSRVDLSRLEVFAVDNESTYEIDDGISIEKIEGDDEFFRVYIHVADPTRFIAFDSPLDREARKRGTTLYLPTESIPMFPKSLSGGKLSLRVANDETTTRNDNEGVALTVQADISRLNGSIRSYDIYPSTISGVTRMTYEDVDATLKMKEEQKMIFICSTSVRSRDIISARMRVRSIFFYPSSTFSFQAPTREVVA